MIFMERGAFNGFVGIEEFLKVFYSLIGALTCIVFREELLEIFFGWIGFSCLIKEFLQVKAFLFEYFTP